MKILFKSLEMRPRGHIVGCGVQGNACLALDLSQGRGGKWAINWSLAGSLGDEAFAARLSKLTGTRHFWVSPSEEGGLQVETARAIEIPRIVQGKKGMREDYFRTQVKSRFVNETIVIGGLRIWGMEMLKGTAMRVVHDIGGGAIKDNVERDYRTWFSQMSIRRPHIASTGLALANAYLALYSPEKRRANPVRVIVLKGRSLYRAILMDDWKYIDEVQLPRMEGDDMNVGVIKGRMDGWIEYFEAQHPELFETQKIDRERAPLVIAVSETHTSEYEHWDLWDEQAMDKIDMTGAVAEPILANRDIAPIAFGMALQGGC